jgi:hypothetical protein
VGGSHQTKSCIRQATNHCVSVADCLAAWPANRHAHPELRRKTYVNDNDVQWHGEAAFKPDWSDSSRLVAYTLKKAAPAVGGLYVAFNSGHTPKVVELPHWHGRAWKVRGCCYCCCWWPGFVSGSCCVCFCSGWHVVLCVRILTVFVCARLSPAAAAAVAAVTTHQQAVIDTGKLAPFDILMPDEELAPEEVTQVGFCFLVVCEGLGGLALLSERFWWTAGQGVSCV